MNDKLNDKLHQIIDHVLPFKQTFYGVLSGIINVGIFNPFDRALSLATEHHTSIFVKDYWNPRFMYQGIYPGIYQRIISYGLWYPAVETVKSQFNKMGESQYMSNHVLAATITSGAIGLIISPISATKQQLWRSKQQVGIFDFGKQMYKIGGLYAFTRASVVTVKRDITFGFVFGYLSSTYNPDKNFLLDTAFATLATTISSPFNYIRIQKYATDCNVYIPASTILKNLIKKVNNDCKGSAIKQIVHTFHHEFKVGWGSLRVGLGMALSRQLYEFFSSH